MIKFFVMQIRLGKITLEQVPEKYREAARDEMNKGVVAPEQVKEITGEDASTE